MCTPGAALVTGFVAGLAAANCYAGSVAYVIEADPVRADAAVPRGSFLSAIALIVAPLGMGMLADVIGLQIAYALVGTAAIVGAFVMLAVTWPSRGAVSTRSSEAPAHHEHEPSVPPSVPAAHAALVPPQETSR